MFSPPKILSSTPPTIPNPILSNLGQITPTNPHNLTANTTITSTSTPSEIDPKQISEKDKIIKSQNDLFDSLQLKSLILPNLKDKFQDQENLDQYFLDNIFYIGSGSFSWEGG